MYRLQPTAIYLLDELENDADALARVDRMLTALGRTRKEARVFGLASAYDVVRELQAWPPGAPAASLPVEHQRPLVFTKLRFDASAEDEPLVADCPEDVPTHHLLQVLGYIDPVRNYHTYESDEERNMVCWPTRDFGVMSGCSHGCFYCGDGRFGKFLALGMNIAEYMREVVEPTILATPDQKCFRMIGWGADIISMEPEYGCFRDYLATLARHDRHGYFHSNSDNVDWLADEPNRDRLIGVWSLASEAVAEKIEPGSPSAAARIAAMRRCVDMGVPVRIKFKPTVPITNWREDYAALIEAVFAEVRPETIGFCCLIWMSLETITQRFGEGLLDPEFMQAAEACVEEMDGETHSPFPHHVRAELYRFLIREVRRWDTDVPIFLSTETREMWAELQDEIGQSARTFMCGCNPVQIPGPRMRPGGAIPSSTYFEPA